MNPDSVPGTRLLCDPAERSPPVTLQKTCQRMVSRGRASSGPRSELPQDAADGRERNHPYDPAVAAEKYYRIILDEKDLAWTLALRRFGEARITSAAPVERSPEDGDSQRDALSTRIRSSAFRLTRPALVLGRRDLYERANGALCERRLRAGGDLFPRTRRIWRSVRQGATGGRMSADTLAIHAGRDAQVTTTPARATLIAGVRQGITRSREQWFRRANRGHPGRCTQSETYRSIARARAERWAALTNERSNARRVKNASSIASRRRQGN